MLSCSCCYIHIDDQAIICYIMYGLLRLDSYWRPDSTNTYFSGDQAIVQIEGKKKKNRNMLL